MKNRSHINITINYYKKINYERHFTRRWSCTTRDRIMPYLGSTFVFVVVSIPYLIINLPTRVPTESLT